MEKNDLLKIEGLKSYFRTNDGIVKAVDGVDLNINVGEALGLVGESGCGKSTLALSILKLVPKPGEIVEGKILYNNEDLLTKSNKQMTKIRGKEISLISQNPMSSLNPVFTIGSQVLEAIALHQEVERSKMREKVLNILDKVRLPNPDKRFNAYPHEFSGGQKQRVITAMALSCRPKLMIADEPTTNLDVTIQAQILDLFKDLRKDSSMSFLLITHDLGIVCDLCDKVAIMYAGKIVEYSDIFTIFEHAMHPYTQAFLRSVPSLDEKVDEFYGIDGDVPSLINPPSGCRFHPRCEYAREICRKQEPKYREIGKGHFVACFFAGDLDKGDL